ncbi:MAG: flagellar motor switch protein FliG [Polyangiales bacterium]
MSALAAAQKETQTDAAAALTGEQKALLFLLSIDESLATKIMAHMEQDEVRRLRSASESLQEVELATVVAVHREFIHAVRGGVPTSLAGSGAYLRRLAGRALGEGKAAAVWNDPKKPKGTVAAMSELEVPTLLALLEREHPQTLALLMSQFAPERASELLGEFPLSIQADVVRRVARLQEVDEQTFREVEKHFAAELMSLGQRNRKQIPGSNAAADILKRMKGEAGEAVMEELRVVDEALATELQNAMFTFDDLVRIDARGMQTLLKEVTTDQLVLALKSASEEIMQKIFGNMSSRAQAMLRDELEMLGPTKLSDVEEARQAIVSTAVRLEREGRIYIAREGASDFIE